MTDNAEKVQTVFVKCLGIAGKQGFCLLPIGYEATFVEFMPNEPLEMKKHYADYIVAQDPHRFIVVDKMSKPQSQEPQPSPAATDSAPKKPSFAERMKAAKAEKKAGKTK